MKTQSFYDCVCSRKKVLKMYKNYYKNSCLSDEEISNLIAMILNGDEPFASLSLELLKINSCKEKMENEKY